MGLLASIAGGSTSNADRHDALDDKDSWLSCLGRQDPAGGMC